MLCWHIFRSVLHIVLLLCCHAVCNEGYGGPIAAVSTCNADGSWSVATGRCFRGRLSHECREGLSGDLRGPAGWWTGITTVGRGDKGHMCDIHRSPACGTARYAVAVTLIGSAKLSNHKGARGSWGTRNDTVNFQQRASWQEQRHVCLQLQFAACK